MQNPVNDIVGNPPVAIVEDKMITCQGCRNQFVWTAGEQGFYAQQGFVPPKRCPQCRRARKNGGQGVI